MGRGKQDPCASDAQPRCGQAKLPKEVREALPPAVEFFHADQVRRQHLLGSPSTVGDMQIADIRDLMAMKLKVTSERGELRDYYDVKEIEERGGVSVEDGIALFRERYGLDRASPAISQLIASLGYLDDCDEDESLPMSKSELAEWWRKRQAKLIRDLGF